VTSAGKALLDDADAAAQRATLGLSTLSTAVSVPGSAITDGTITNDDISTTAAIDQSKISGLTTALSGKEPTITAGTTTQYLRGDKTWQTLATGARSALSITAPLTYNTGTGVFGLSQASSGADGYLSSSDFTVFNNKQAAISAATTVNAGTVTTALQNGVQIKPYGTAAGNAGELRFSELAANGANFVGFKAPDTLGADKIWTLPAADGTSGQVLKTDGSGALSWANNASGVMTGTGGGAAPHPSSGCPTGYTLVPGDTDYGTTDFCVMKYEAKFGDKGAVSQATEVPARGGISQNTAYAACRNLGPGYALINNAEWMTIASNIANVGTNWSGGTVGSGALNHGHTDGTPGDALAAVTDDNDPCNGTGQTCSSSTWNNQRRTHVLSNSNVIWDFSGNVWEWVDYYNRDNKPTPANAAWNEYTAVSGSTYMAKNRLVPTNALKSWWSDSWNGATNGIGQYYGGTNGGGGALLRGGAWDVGSGAGVFAVSLGNAPSDTHTRIGFRCVFRPSSL